MMENYILRVNSFDVKVSWECDPCPIEYALSFELTGVDYSDTIRKVLNGELEHMIITLTAYKNGVELATNCLGNCIYSDLESALKDWVGGYLPQMLEEVTEEAKETILKLVA